MFISEFEGNDDSYNNEFHNIEFRNKMASMGIHCDSRGHAIKITNPFVSFLKKHKIEIVI